MTNKFAAGFLSVGIFFALGAPVAQASLTEAQIQSILSLLNSFGADSSVVSNVESSLRGQAPTGGNNGGGSSAAVCPFTWTRSLTVGDTGADVLALQQFLNSDSATMIASSGVGSAGNETDYFGSLTAAAVAKFQDKYASEVLAPVGLSAGTGFFGSSTRAKANALCVSGAGNNNGGNNGGSAPVTGAGLNVMLASDSPDNVALVQGQGIGELAKFTFTNNNNAAMDVDGLTFNRIGVSTDATLGDIFLFRGGERLTDAAAVSNSQFSFQNSAGIFEVPAGSTVTISVRANIASGTNGQQVGASLASVNASGALNSGVSLPIMGGIHTISSATLASMTFQTYNGPNGDANFTPADNTEVWENSVVVSTRDVVLHSLTLKNEGSADPEDFANLQLFIDGTQYGSTVPTLNSSDKVVFDLSSNPVTLDTGTRTFRVLADVVGGSGETFDFEVDKTADVLAIDSELNQTVTPTLTATSGAANTIDSASLSVTKAANSPSESVAVDATNVLWATFEFRATGEDVKVEALTVDADVSGSAGGLDVGKVFLNGSQVGSNRDIAETGTEFTFGSSMILRQGETAIVEIYADAKTTTAASLLAGENVTVGVSIASSDTEGLDSGNSAAAVSQVDGNQRTIASSAVTATKFSGYGDQTMIAGANDARLGSFTLSGASTEDTNINQLTIALSSDEAATVTNLMLKDRSTGAQLGNTRVSPGTSNSYSVNFTLPESGTKTIDLIGNIKSGSNAGSWQAEISGTGSGVDTGSTISISPAVALQTITIGSGSLAASIGAGDPNSDNVVAGSSSVHVGQFNFAASNSPYTVREMQIKLPNDASTSVTNVTLKYTNSQGAVEERSQAVVTGTGDGTATFTGLDFHIPSDDDRNVDVYVGIPTIASGAKSGAAISVDLDWNTGFKATDAAGTTIVEVGSADVSAAGTFYVRKSVPTFGTASKPTTVPSSGVALYEFSISADSAGAIEWKEITFDVATNGVTLSGFYLREKGESTNINDAPNAEADSSNDVVIYAGTSLNNDVEQIAAGATRTYQLFATTVTGWGNDGDSININIVEDSTFTANATANSILDSNTITWSDRSATSHTTATSDWTNGFLVDDLSGGDAVSYSQ